MAKQGTQEFFPRSRGAEGKQGGFIFNKAPINRNEARQEAKTKVVHDREAAGHRAARGTSGRNAASSGFLSKLYQDDDELDNLRVLGAVDDDDEEVQEARNALAEQPESNKRKTKATTKQGIVGVKVAGNATKIGRLQSFLKKGALGMFAVCEIAPDHLIVNHTRNTKGFISLKGTKMSGHAHKYFRIGQYVVASVVTEIGTSSSGQIYDFKHGSGVNRKVQMSIEPAVINRLLSSKNVGRGMVLQGVVSSKEAKGYIIDLGFKDETKAFLKYDSEQKESSEKKQKTLKEGSVVQVVVKSVIEASKIVKCELLKSETHCSAEHCVQQVSGEEKTPVTTSHVKPGFLVNAKIQRVVENGLELSFLGGITGTCFVDHASARTAQAALTDHKVGQKVLARVISADPIQKRIALSLTDNIVNWARASQGKAENTELRDIKVGSVYEDVKVIRALYGGSYLVQLGGSSGPTAFLHKSHSRKDEGAATAEGDSATNQGQADERLEEGQVLPSVRVKEINWFDGMAVVTIRESLLKTDQLSYHHIEVGQFVKAKIAKVDPATRSVVLKVNDFVQGTLFLEHMADQPLKTMPPKFTEVGKELNLRVLHVDAPTRLIEFTKKDSLMKEDCPVYKTHRDIKNGDKVVGVVVSSNEYGHVVRSFGTLKGLLTYDDIKEKQQKKDQGEKQVDYKVGSIVKAYCLFKKAGKGVALTLSKKKAAANASSQEGAITKQKSLDSQLPSEQEIQELFSQDRFSTMAKSSRNRDLVGEVHRFRLISQESDDREYFVLKSTDAVKKSKNFVGILPKCLVPHEWMLKESQELEGLVLWMIGPETQLVPVISIQKELVLLKDEMKAAGADALSSPGQSYVGVTCGLVGKAGQLGVKFLNGIQRSIKVKDLNTTQSYSTIYYPGKVVRVATNKQGRLGTKEKVIDACLASQPARPLSDKEVQLKAFSSRFAESLGFCNLQIGEVVEATVQLVKDYGIIAKIARPNEEGKDGEAPTGFIINEQRKSNDKKQYKVGQKLACCVLDVDPVKRIVDLSEKLASAQATKGQGLEPKKGQQLTATVELNKESYAIVSVKGPKQSRAIGVCLLHNFNGDDQVSPYQGVQVGDELAVSAAGKNESGFLELLPEVKKVKKKTPAAQTVSISEGARFKGQIAGIKNQSAFIHVKEQSGSLILGRLLQSECDSAEEFLGLSKGDSIEVKVLQLSKSAAGAKAGASWMELTKRKAHMAKSDGLDEAQKAQSLMTLADLKVGQVFERALVLGPTSEPALDLRHSRPLQIQVSTLARGKVPFNHIVTAQALARHGSDILQAKNLKGGSVVKASYLGDGNFSLIGEARKADKALKKGDLVTVRFVNIVRGRGVTVQISESVYGFIEQCEITDQLAGNVFKLLEARRVFAARIIDQDAAGKWQLSARESVVDDDSWNGAIGPLGPSKEFVLQDKARQQSGNQRNKILKYGAAVALSKGDLAVGFVTNIGKAGCFVQIGHKCTVRAGLNELSDAASYDFAKEMPVGRMVLGRITKVEDQANGEKRFHFSTRQSLVVYGVGAIDRSKLEVGGEVTSIVMAIAEGKAFCQIKGTYIKLKVKGFGEERLQPGDHVIARLTKIDKQKISSEYLGRAPFADQRGGHLTQDEKMAETLYQTAQNEFKSEMQALQALGAKSGGKSANEVDFDPKVVELSQDDEEEIAKQMEDLKALEENDQNEPEIDDDDSDAEEMRRLIQLDQSSEEGGPDEEGEQELEESDEEMEAEQDDEDEDAEEGDASSEEEGETDEKGRAKKSMLKKRTLKERLKEEQEIRDKEKRMRAETDKPQDIDDFERLLVGNQDESYLWIQYMAFMLDKVGLDAARKVVERATSSVSMASEQNKLNIWTAFMNLESNFGTQETLEAVTKRALEVNDRRKVYVNLIDIYKSSMKYNYIEAIYRQLTKKYGNSLEIWAGYLEFLIEMRQRKKEGMEDENANEHSDPKQVLQRALQSLSSDQHVNIISKLGMLEFKFGSPENGRTMFEGIVSNYPKRMDIWAIYMDMEVKYGQNNITQARHLFERCLSNEHIQKKPKKMKLVFQKYMDFENRQGSKAKLDALRQRVEQYLSQVYGNNEASDQQEESDQEIKQEKDGAVQESEDEVSSQEDDEPKESNGEDSDDQQSGSNSD